METVIKLLLICSPVTALVVEALKKMIPESMDNAYSKNLLAAVVSVVVSVAVSTGYLVLNNTKLSPQIWVYVVILIVLSWLCSMLGFDKIKQTILQIKRGGNDQTN